MKFIILIIVLVHCWFSLEQPITYINSKPVIIDKNLVTSKLDTVYGNILTYRYYYGNSKQYYDFERYIFKKKYNLYSYVNHLDTNLYRKLFYTEKLQGFFLFGSYYLDCEVLQPNYYATTHTGCVIFTRGQHLTSSALFVLDSIPSRRKYISSFGEIFIKHIETRKSNIYIGYYEYLYNVYYTNSPKIVAYSIVYIPNIGVVSGITYHFFGLKKRKIVLLKMNGQYISNIIPSIKKRGKSFPCDVL